MLHFFRRFPALQTFVIFAGGFLGPFTGQMPAVILPEISKTYGITVETAALALVAYMAPFATVMLISGWVGGRLGFSRVIRTAFACFALFALIATVSPSWELFVVAFALCGVTNAFTTPLLLTILRDSTAPENLGKRLGLYASMQALGQLSAPMVGGLAALVEWRFAFVGVAIVAGTLAIIGLPRSERLAESRGSFRSLFISRTNIALIATCLAVGIGGLGVPFLVSLHAFEVADASSVARGAIIMTGGITAFFGANIIGRLIDRFGAARVVVASVLISITGLSILPFVDLIPLLAAVWALTTLGAQGSLIALNRLVLDRPRSHILISFAQSARFYGSALTPVIVLPFYTFSPLAGFGLTVAIMLIGLTVFLFLRERNTETGANS